MTDAARHLTGVLSLRELVTAHPEQKVGEIATRDVVFVCTHTDREEVARTISDRIGKKTDCYPLGSVDLNC